MIEISKRLQHTLSYCHQISRETYEDGRKIMNEFVINHVTAEGVALSVAACVVVGSLIFTFQKPRPLQPKGPKCDQTSQVTQTTQATTTAEESENANHDLPAQITSIVKEVNQISDYVTSLQTRTELQKGDIELQKTMQDEFKARMAETLDLTVALGERMNRLDLRNDQTEQNICKLVDLSQQQEEKLAENSKLIMEIREETLGMTLQGKSGFAPNVEYVTFASENPEPLPNDGQTIDGDTSQVLSKVSSHSNMQDSAASQELKIALTAMKSEVLDLSEDQIKSATRDISNKFKEDFEKLKDQTFKLNESTISHRITHMDRQVQHDLEESELLRRESEIKIKGQMSDLEIKFLQKVEALEKKMKFLQSENDRLSGELSAVKTHPNTENSVTGSSLSVDPSTADASVGSLPNDGDRNRDGIDKNVTPVQHDQLDNADSQNKPISGLGDGRVESFNLKNMASPVANSTPVNMDARGKDVNPTTMLKQAAKNTLASHTSVFKSKIRPPSSKTSPTVSPKVAGQ